MLGTFAGALDARKINAKDSRLTAEVKGEVENSEDGVLIIRRVHVHYRLRAEAPEEVRETVERVHGFYVEKCPVYRSLRTSSYELVAG